MSANGVLEEFWSGTRLDLAKSTLPHSAFKVVGGELVATFPITVMEGFPLGPFTAKIFRYEEEDLEVLIASENENPDGFCHPHVDTNGSPCFGEGGRYIDICLDGGDLATLTDLIQVFLRTRSPYTPYFPIDKWDGYYCRECGEVTQVMRTCGCKICESCKGKCRWCGRDRCCHVRCDGADATRKFAEITLYPSAVVRELENTSLELNITDQGLHVPLRPGFTAILPDARSTKVKVLHDGKHPNIGKTGNLIWRGGWKKAYVECLPRFFIDQIVATINKCLDERGGKSGNL